MFSRSCSLVEREEWSFDLLVVAVDRREWSFGPLLGSMEDVSAISFAETKEMAD